MRNPNALTPQQLGVLAWVAGGCEAGIYEENNFHRIVARGLANRGFITISGRGKSWSARATSFGLEHLNKPVETTPVVNASELDRLWDTVLSAGGAIGTDQLGDFPDWKLLVQHALRSPTRPFAQTLQVVGVGGWSSSRSELRVVEHPADRFKPRPVPILEAPRKLHPAVSSAIPGKHIERLSDQLVPRAKRLLHSIAVEAEIRGRSALTSSHAIETGSSTEARRLKNVHLVIGAEGGNFEIQVHEASGLPTVARAAEGFISSGRLELRLDGPAIPYGGQPFRDSKGTFVEELLPQLFQAIDVASYKSIQLAAAREHEAKRAVQAKADARQRALEAYRQHALAVVLKGQFESWQRFNEMQPFLQDLRMRVKEAGGDADGQRWLDWATQETQKLNPFREQVRMPVIQDPSESDLKPFIRGPRLPWE